MEINLTPGFYYIPFLTFNGKDFETKSINVEVVSVFNDRGTQFIIVPDKKHNFYYIFYYSEHDNCFKRAWDAYSEYEDILRWLNQDEDYF